MDSHGAVSHQNPPELPMKDVPLSETKKSGEKSGSLDEDTRPGRSYQLGVGIQKEV